VPDALGWRAIFGVLAPSTNTIVEPDFHRMAVPGVTAQVARIHIRDASLADDAAFEALIAEIEREIDAACERIMTCRPDRLVMGMSAETFWGGAEGNRVLRARVEASTGLPLVTGADAVEQALRAHGARRVAVLTPYQPVGDANVRRFLDETGFDVVRIIGLRCPTAHSIARVTETRLRETLRALDGDDVDALLQVGTNLSMVGLADEAERRLDKPVIAINAATWWRALRDHGIPDRIAGAGALLREY
jgi:maleate isomerase